MLVSHNKICPYRRGLKKYKNGSAFTRTLHFTDSPSSFKVTNEITTPLNRFDFWSKLGVIFHKNR